MQGLLAGVRVLEVGDEVAVRYCGRLFAALGADVVRLDRADDRGIGYAGRCGEAYGRWLDCGKAFAGGAVTGEGFDLVVGGQDAAGVARAASLCAAGGSAVLLALTWFDPDGPYGTWLATDETILALSGAAYSFGAREGPPMLAQGHAPQITAGLVAFIAAAAALLAAPGRRCGRIDVNVFEAALCYSEPGAVIGRFTGTPSERLGVNRFAPTSPSAPYRTADGWIGLTCLTPAQWHALCRLIDRPDLATDPRFATGLERLAISDEVDAALADAIPRRTSAEWLALGIAHRIPTAPVPHPGELPGEAHWRARGAFASFDGGAVEGPTLPFRMTFDGVTTGRPTGAGADGPLAGLRVADFSMGWAGPLCARTLGDLGADVVKVESEAHPDWWRGWEAGEGESAAREVRHNFINGNRNKRGVDVDLTRPLGAAQARALIARADVVVENYAAGVLEKLGLGPAVQRALKPGLISLSMPAFGNGGPLSAIRAYGSTVEQASGLTFVNGEADWVPCQQHVAFGDPIAGLYGAAGVLAALQGRQRLGGAEIDMAQVGCLFQIGADAIIAEQVLQAHVPRTGHARARLELCAVVRGAGEDGWLAAAAPDAKAAAALAAVTGGPGVQALSQWAAARDPQAAAAILQAAGVAAAPVRAPHLLTFDPHLDATGFWLEADRAFVGPHLVGASPFRFDGARPRVRRPAPVLGEHTAEVLAEIA